MTGVVKMDPKPKCIRFYGIDVDLDFERIDVSTNFKVKEYKIEINSRNFFSTPYSNMEM